MQSGIDRSLMEFVVLLDIGSINVQVRFLCGLEYLGCPDDTYWKGNNIDINFVEVKENTLFCQGHEGVGTGHRL